ncbi:response regulator [Klebsiella pneumoniae]|nr:response regulator [Klebsiella pneumoniae]
MIIISARTSEMHRVLGLEMGADDYLAEALFIAGAYRPRQSAVVGRQEAMGQNLLMDAGRLSCHGLKHRPLSREVKLRGETVDLTPREFDLLYYFARHPGEVFSRLALLEQVWGYQHEGYEHTVNTISTACAVKSNVTRPSRTSFLPVWGKGYKFAPVTQEPSRDPPPEPQPAAGAGGGFPADAMRGGGMRRPVTQQARSMATPWCSVCRPGWLNRLSPASRCWTPTARSTGKP